MSTCRLCPKLDHTSVLNFSAFLGDSPRTIALSQNLCVDLLPLFTSTIHLQLHSCFQVVKEAVHYRVCQRVFFLWDDDAPNLEITYCPTKGYDIFFRIAAGTLYASFPTLKILLKVAFHHIFLFFVTGSGSGSGRMKIKMVYAMI